MLYNIYIGKETSFFPHLDDIGDRPLNIKHQFGEREVEHYFTTELESWFQGGVADGYSNISHLFSFYLRNHCGNKKEVTRLRP